MKVQVIYFSRKGSTKKVADVIASEMDVEPEDVKNVELKKDTIVFLGSGCYGGKPSKQIIDFIEDNDFNGTSVGLFGTSGSGIGKEVDEMEKQLSLKNAKIIGKFFCKGKFTIMNRDKPNDKDLNEAKMFANKLKHY